MESSSESQQLLQAREGDQNALGQLLLSNSDRLTRVVGFRLDRRLRGRVDPSDIVQDAFVDATIRFQEFAAEQPMPFFLWLRFLTLQKLSETHRRHLGVKARDAGRDVSLYAGPLPQATSAVLAAQLLGKHSTPSQAAMRAEIKLQLESALNEMDNIDREVVALRHFEQLTNTEAAAVLGITESAASNRYVRALKRLRIILERMEQQGP